MFYGMDFEELRKTVRRRAAEIGRISPNELPFIDEYEKIIDQLLEHRIPEKYPEATFGFLGSIEQGMCSLLYRELIIALSGYAVLAYEWIRPLAAWIGERRCLEIMSGSGALSYGLQQCGVDIVATDNGEWIEPSSPWAIQPWYDVERLDCLDAIKKYGADRSIIICSWPEMNDTAYRALLKMREVNPDALMVYIGEIGCGATADENFSREAEYAENPEFEKAVSAYKPFSAIHDYPYLVK